MNILLPIDGSAQALAAAAHALLLQREGLRTNFVLAAIQEPIYGYEMMLPADERLVERLSGAAGERALMEAKALFASAGVTVKCEIDSGDPATMLLEIAKRCGCEAIIMGARGMGFLRSALLGSVSQAILQRATIPVTIVNHSAAKNSEEPIEGEERAAL
jgi:nucleotide-binding universal stress UspA family protein